jgi:outer membrane protein, heavy metal efflux system
MRRHCTIGILIFVVMGCAKVPPPEDGTVSCIVAGRINGSAEWRRGCCQDNRAQEFICCSIANELTADRAIQVALLNNPKIQASFEELGVSRAGLVEAGLLSNPSFEIEIRYPHVRWLKTNIEYLITSCLLDIFLIPLRTRLARTEFEQTKLRVSNEILDLAFEVRETYYKLIYERNNMNCLIGIVELVGISSEISSRQIEIGNVNARASASKISCHQDPKEIVIGTVTLSHFGL